LPDLLERLVEWNSAGDCAHRLLAAAAGLDNGQLAQELTDTVT
jgi:hypothetical protein